MDFKSIQKLRFFLGAVFPALARDPPRSKRVQAWLERNPKARARLERLWQSRINRNLVKANESYGLGTYSGGVLDWSMIPPGVVVIMRAGVILATLLCLLVPLAMTWTVPALPAEPITGADGPPVAGWSVVFWLLGGALAWSTLLVGTGTSNRWLLVPAILLFEYFDGAMVGVAGRSWWNLAVFASSAWILVYAEARAIATRVAPAWWSWTVAIGGGTLAAIAGIALSPLGALVSGKVLWFGAAAGVPVGAACRWLGRRIGRSVASDENNALRWPVYLRPDLAAGIIAGLQLVFAAWAAIHGGLTIPAGGMQGLAVQATGYLWPLFYFIGVGIVFRLIRQTKFIHGVARDILPGPFFVIAGLFFLLAGTWVTWGDVVLTHAGITWWSWVFQLAVWSRQASHWLWSRQLWAFSLDWMRWVFLVAGAMAVWALIRRKLTSETMSAILFPTVLLWLAIFEYHFEFSGFARSPLQSTTGLLAFSIFVLWLFHLTTRPFLTGGSRWWSAQARVLIYVAGLMFVIVPVHVRSALHDRTLANEIFLYLFFGILDLGVPYYLYLYAERRFQRLPFRPLQLLAFFGAGAALSVPLIIGDKLAVAGGSWSAMWAVVNAQVDASLRGEHWADVSTFVPQGWLLVRGGMVLAAMFAAVPWARRWCRDAPLQPAAAVFGVVAVATGVASFSNHAFELPLMSNRVSQLITPLNVSRSIDPALVARFCAHVVPALIIVLSVTGRAAPWRRYGGIIMAAALHLGIIWLWPHEEPWLQSTGLFPLMGAAGLIVVLTLVVVVRGHLDATLETKVGAGGSTPALPAGHLVMAASVLVVILAGWGAWRVYRHRLVDYTVLNGAVTVRLPAVWQAGQPNPAGAVAFSAPTTYWLMPLFTEELRPCVDGDVHAVLSTLVATVGPQLTDFYQYPTEDWSRYRDGAVALEYQFDRPLNGFSVTVFGTVTIIPHGPDQALVMNVLYEIGDRDRRWDLARMLQVPEFDPN